MGVLERLSLILLSRLNSGKKGDDRGRSEGRRDGVGGCNERGGGVCIKALLWGISKYSSREDTQRYLHNFSASLSFHGKSTISTLHPLKAIN